MKPLQKKSPAAQALIVEGKLRQLQPLLSTIQAAPLAGVEPHTLEKWRADHNRGPRHLKIGRRVYYDPDDIAEWRESCRISSTAENDKLKVAA